MKEVTGACFLCAFIQFPLIPVEVFTLGFEQALDSWALIITAELEKLFSAVNVKQMLTACWISEGVKDAALSQC